MKLIWKKKSGLNLLTKSRIFICSRLLIPTVFIRDVSEKLVVMLSKWSLTDDEMSDLREKTKHIVRVGTTVVEHKEEIIEMINNDIEAKSDIKSEVKFEDKKEVLVSEIDEIKREVFKLYMAFLKQDYKKMGDIFERLSYGF